MYVAAASFRVGTRMGVSGGAGGGSETGRMELEDFFGGGI